MFERIPNAALTKLNAPVGHLAAGGARGVLALSGSRVSVALPAVSFLECSAKGSDRGRARFVSEAPHGFNACRVLRDEAEVGWTKPVKNRIAVRDAAVELATQHRTSVERMVPGHTPSALRGLGVKPEGAELVGIIRLQELMPFSQPEIDAWDRRQNERRKAVDKASDENRARGYEEMYAAERDPSKWHGGPRPAA